MKIFHARSRIVRSCTTLIIAFGVPLLALKLIPNPADAQVLPNTLMTCPASSNSIPFTSWFNGGNPALNAAVTPADSVNFPNGLNPDFYRWSFRMFLWLTSPTPAAYGGTGRVLSSPEFYNVSPEDPVTHLRTMTQNRSNPSLQTGSQNMEQGRLKEPEPISLDVRVANLGVHGFPIIKTKQGQIMEAIPPKVSDDGHLLTLNAENKEVMVAQVQRGKSGEVRFLDTKGKAIARPQLQLQIHAQNVLGTEKMKEKVIPRFKFAFKIDPALVKGVAFRQPIFILPTGTIVDPEVAQAGGQVQMTQSGSLIYYGIEVNDVFAYYLTAENQGAITNIQFPVNANDLTAITTFGAQNGGHSFLNPNALAIEIKTSWVDAAAVPNANDHITMMAKVPTYYTGNPQHWLQNGTKTIRVALIGMHVVGSANGHPEMIWATFEHVGNTPNVNYGFITPNNTPQNQGADPIGSSSSWLFCGATTPTTPFQPNASSVGIGAIDTNVGGKPVQGTSVMRLAPWGAPTNFRPNPNVQTSADSNTEVISLNNDVRAQMDPNDVRVRYLFLGATWTEFGGAPSTNFHNNGPTPGLVVGTNHLANSTMETYTQSKFWVAGNMPGPGCLSCHTSNNAGVSHIFADTKPLF